MSADDEMAGRVVLVTGAASGIGLRAIERLHAAGAHVVALDRVAIPAEAALARRHDVTDEGDWEEAVAEVLDRYGRIDGLVACAGIIAMAPITEMALGDFRRVMAVNVEGCFLGLKHVMRPMLAAGRGSIVNLSSTAGIAGAPGAGAYCASKGAVRMLSKSAALDAIATGGRVRVNSLHPAMTQTPMVAEIVRQLGGGSDVEDQMRSLQPSGDFITTDAVVDSILFLLSDRSSFVNGSEMLVDNGFLAQ